MKYSFADEVTSGKPVHVMKSDSTAKKNCFLSIDEVPMTLKLAKAIAKAMNTVFDIHMKHR